MNDEKSVKKQEKTPSQRHAFITLGVILVLVAIVSQFIPSGEYARFETPDGRMVVDANSFTVLEKGAINIMDFVTAIPRGIQDAGGVIVITLTVGGLFGVIEKVGFINTAVMGLVERLKDKRIAIIPILYAVFATITAFIGTPELVLVYIPIIMPLFFQLGYDSITTAAVPLVATAIGFAGAVTAPATVGIGHTLAELPMFSGMGVRIISILILSVVANIYIINYARKVLADPKASPVYEKDLLTKAELKEEKESQPEVEYPRANLAGIVAAVLFIAMIIGVVSQSWGFNEMSGIFIIIGIITGLVAGMGLNETVSQFAKGMEDMLVGAMVCGLARAISIVLADAQVMDTIIMYLANLITVLPPSAGAIGMLIVVSLFNAVIASGSGKAVIALPIMLPLADIAGITRQTAILAYQMGDSLTNILWPASGYYMVALTQARISLGDWVKWYMPLLIMLSITCAIILYFCTMFGYGPF